LLEGLFPLLKLFGLAVENIVALAQPQLGLSQLGTGTICLGCELLLLLDGFGGGINLSGLDYILRFSLGAFDLAFQVLVKGLGLGSGDHLSNQGGKADSQKKGYDRRSHFRQFYLH
jgi:hypothetical protein